MLNVAFNTLTSPQLKKNSPYHLQAVHKKGNIHYLKKDVLQFKGYDRFSRFSRLDEFEKNQIQAALEYIYSEEKQGLHTVLGKKPAALVILPPEYSQILMTYQDIVMPENLALVKVKRKLPYSRKLKNESLYIINIPETTKVVEKHLDYFRKRLNESNLTAQGVVQRLIGEHSPLKDMDNYGDIAGIILGFPFGDNLVFRLYYEAKIMCESIQDSADKTQKQILSTVMQLLRQDIVFRENPLSGEIEPIGNKEPSTTRPLGVPVPHLHPGIRSLYKYYTWEGNSERNKAFSQKIEADVQSTNDFFDSADKFIHYMLVTNVYK